MPWPVQRFPLCYFSIKFEPENLLDQVISSGNEQKIDKLSSGKSWTKANLLDLSGFSVFIFFTSQSTFQSSLSNVDKYAT